MRNKEKFKHSFPPHFVTCKLESNEQNPVQQKTLMHLLDFPPGLSLLDFSPDLSMDFSPALSVGFFTRLVSVGFAPRLVSV
jgi:hypothetical protein